MRPATRLQFLTLGDCPSGHARQAEQACEGGIRWVQLRAKGLAELEWIALARDVAAVCRAHGATCIVNDSPAVARAAGGDGVHLGKDDADPGSARALLGPDALIGVTLNHLSDIERLRTGAPDYVGVGPFRATETKAGHAPVHAPDSLRALVAAAGRPAYVIGGLRLEDLSAVRAAGAQGVAVSAAIARAQDIRAAAADWVRQVADCWGDT